MHELISFLLVLCIKKTFLNSMVNCKISTYLHIVFNIKKFALKNEGVSSPISFNKLTLISKIDIAK